MYKVDGFDLSTSEFEQLDSMRRTSREEPLVWETDFTSDASVMRRLSAMELIEGWSIGDNRMKYRITHLGRCFLEDWEKEERLREEERRRRERFEWRISVCSSLLGVLGTVLGFILSAIWSVATGQVALVGW